MVQCQPCADAHLGKPGPVLFPGVEHQGLVDLQDGRTVLDDLVKHCVVNCPTTVGKSVVGWNEL